PVARVWPVGVSSIARFSSAHRALIHLNAVTEGVGDIQRPARIERKTGWLAEILLERMHAAGRFPLSGQVVARDQRSLRHLRELVAVSCQDCQNVALAGENLDPVVTPVSHRHVAVTVNRNARRTPQLAWPGARPAEAPQETTVKREHLDPVVLPI